MESFIVLYTVTGQIGATGQLHSHSVKACSHEDAAAQTTEEFTGIEVVFVAKTDSLQVAKNRYTQYLMQNKGNTHNTLSDRNHVAYDSALTVADIGSMSLGKAMGKSPCNVTPRPSGSNILGTGASKEGGVSAKDTDFLDGAGKAIGDVAEGIGDVISSIFS